MEDVSVVVEVDAAVVLEDVGADEIRLVGEFVDGVAG